MRFPVQEVIAGSSPVSLVRFLMEGDRLAPELVLKTSGTVRCGVRCLHLPFCIWEVSVCGAGGLFATQYAPNGSEVRVLCFPLEFVSFMPLQHTGCASTWYVEGKEFESPLRLVSAMPF